VASEAVPSASSPSPSPSPATPATGSPAPAASKAATSPELSWGEPVATRRGEQFTVEINGAGFDGVDAVPLLVQYDPHIHGFVGADVGELAASAGASPADQLVNQAAGRVSMTLKPDPNKRLNGSGTLMKLRFTALLARPVTQLMLARVDLREGGTTQTVPRPQPLTIRVDP
jgi:hypothetical protein